MWIQNTRTLFGGMLLLCVASGCAGRHHCVRNGMHHVGQCGQGHTSVLDCMLSKMDPCYQQRRCADGCEPQCAPYATPGMTAPGMTQPNPATSEPQSVPQFSPPPAPEPLSGPLRLLRRGRRMLHRLPDSLELSIPLPTRWIGSTAPTEEPQPNEESQESMGEILSNQPVAVAEPGTTVPAETAQIVGYEYGQPVELAAPRFDDAEKEYTPPPPIGGGYSVQIRPLRR